MRVPGLRALIFPTLLILSVASVVVYAQTDSFTKNFKKFPEVAPGVDFFAAQRADVAPFEKPLNEGRQKLAAFLGDPLAKGAIVICSTLAQKDSVSEARVLKMGYRWALIQLTPAAANEQMMAQMKAQLEQMKDRMGGQLPPGLLERMKNPSPEMKAAAEARLLSSVVQRFGYAVLMSTLAPDKPFRSSRLDDMGRSPLADWLDVGLVVYATENAPLQMRLLQDRLDEAFPMEDFIEMSRPFVPPSAGGGGPSAGGPIMIQRSPGPAPTPGGGGPPAAAGGTRPGGAALPKDVQDRMTFDAQAAAFFSYLVNKVGPAKVKELVQWNRAGKEVREFLTRADVLGPDLDKAEKDWQAWVKTQKVDRPGPQIIMGSGASPRPAPEAKGGARKEKSGEVKTKNEQP